MLFNNTEPIYFGWKVSALHTRGVLPESDKELQRKSQLIEHNEQKGGS